MGTFDIERAYHQDTNVQKQFNIENDDFPEIFPLILVEMNNFTGAIIKWRFNTQFPIATLFVYFNKPTLMCGSKH